MLAKHYQYTYEAIKSTKNAMSATMLKRYPKNKQDKEILTKQDTYYPIYNIERVADQIEQLKKEIIKEIKNKEIKDSETIKAYLIQRWEELIVQYVNNGEFRIILEPGYKEPLQCVSQENLFQFDFSDIVRVNTKQEKITLDHININGVNYHMSKLSKKSILLNFNFQER